MRKTSILRRLGVLLLTVTMMISAVPVYASVGREDRETVDYTGVVEWPDGPELDSAGAYLIELNTGTVLYSKDADSALYPASITKILTAMIVLENCELTEEVTFSYDAVHDLESGAYSYIAAEGDVLTVEDCLYALLLSSSNEAAYALAEHVAGSVSAFADLMNEKAEELGCTNSHFANPHGLYDEDHYTTPHDMALIMWAALQNEDFLKIDSTISYTTAPTSTYTDGFPCTMHHGMMLTSNEYYNSSVVAGKTGYISAAKNTLVTYAVEGDLELVCVVMCANGSSKAYEDTQALLDYALENFSLQTVSAEVDLGTWEDAVAEVTDRVVQNFTCSGLTSAEEEEEDDDTEETGYTVTADLEVLLPNSLSGDIVFDTVFTVDEDSVPESGESGNEMTGVLTFSFSGIELCSETVTITLVEQKTTVRTSSSVTSGGGGLPIWIGVVLCVIVVLILLLIILQAMARHRRQKRREETRRRRRQQELKKREEANRKAEKGIEHLTSRSRNQSDDDV